MNAVLICYKLNRATQTKRTELKRKLRGYKDFSNKGRYSYQRKGLIMEIPHIKPTKTSFIVKKGSEIKIKKLLNEFGAIIKTYNIKINKTEFKQDS